MQKEFNPIPPSPSQIPTTQTPNPSPKPDIAPKPKQPVHSYFWPGFLIALALCTLASCGGLAMAMGVDEISLADLQNNKNGWAPPTATATLLPILTTSQTPEPIPASEIDTFQLGDTVQNITVSRVNIRRTPGYLGKPDTDIVAQLQPNDTMQILGDFASVDNLDWWRIRYQPPDGRIFEGWVAEATASNVQILGLIE